MSLITLNGVSGAGRVTRFVDLQVNGELITVALRTSEGSKYPSTTVRLDQFLARLANLDEQENRIPPVTGDNDLTIALMDGMAWLWVRRADRDDGGADAIVSLPSLRQAIVNTASNVG